MHSALAFVALSAVVLLSLAPAGAAAACLPGKYAGTGGKEGDQPFPVLVTIACEGEAARGQIESPFGVIPISEGDVAADRWRLEAVADGVQVKLEDTIKGFKGLCEGQYDYLPEPSFYMVGTIQEAVDKGKKLAEAA